MNPCPRPVIINQGGTGPWSYEAFLSVITLKSDYMLCEWVKQVAPSVIWEWNRNDKLNYYVMKVTMQGSDFNNASLCQFLHCGGLPTLWGPTGDVLLFVVMSFRISPRQGSRFTTFLVSIILICFHRQAAQTQSLEFLSHFSLRPSVSPCGHARGESRVASIFLCVFHMCSPFIQSELSDLPGASHWSHADGMHSAVTAEKTKRKKGDVRAWGNTVLLQRSKSELECVRRSARQAS